MKEQLKIEGQGVELVVHHGDQDLRFRYPPYENDSYANLAEVITRDGLKRPALAEVIGLIYATQTTKSDTNKLLNHYRESACCLYGEGLWGFTSILFSHGRKRGVYIEDDPRIEDKLPIMRESDLIKRLEDHDPRVRFVPYNEKYGFCACDKNGSEITKDPLVVGLLGEEGACKWAQMISPHDEPVDFINYLDPDESALDIPSLLDEKELFVAVPMIKSCGTRIEFIEPGNDYYDGVTAKAFGLLKLPYKHTENESRATKSCSKSKPNFHEIQGTPGPVRYVNVPGCGLTKFTREYGPNDGDGLTD